MLAFAGMGADLGAFLGRWRAVSQEHWAGPVMLQWAGALEWLDPGGLPIPVNLDDLVTPAIEAGGISASEPYAVELPDGPERGAYFGFARPDEGRPLQEIAIAHDDLLQALGALLAAMPGLYELQGLSDASLADETASFAGKPLGLAALSISMGARAELHLGEEMRSEDWDDD